MIEKGTAKQAILRFGGNAVTYDFSAAKLDGMPLAAEDGTVTFRVLVDRPMFEVVGGGGACYKTARRNDGGRPLGTVSLTAQGGDLKVGSLTVHDMQSIWKKK